MLANTRRLSIANLPSNFLQFQEVIISSTTSKSPQISLQYLAPSPIKIKRDANDYNALVFACLVVIVLVSAWGWRNCFTPLLHQQPDASLPKGNSGAHQSGCDLVNVGGNTTDTSLT